MVHQITNKNVIDLEVCSVSYQRHCTSLLKKRGKITNSLCKKPTMAEAENTSRHPLPVVELRPFSKKVWRREKSLPDFYDRKRPEEINTSSNSNSAPDSETPGSRLIREVTDTRRSIESRQHTLDSALGKYRNHPKAEFLHESNKAWRKQDLIPSFITRFERTKTSLETLSRDNTLNRINLENTSMFENALKREPNPMIKIKGGKMNQQIQRRHFLYLNPLDTYRQPNSWLPHFNSTSNTRQHTTRDKLLLSSRHSLPLTSSRTRDLLLGDSQAQYPLKPIRREDMESPHKFNSKLGAAKNSLEVLSKVGIQTKLEKTLEKEMELNMEKFRKDRLSFTNDMRGVPFQCFNVESNLTVGEMSLKTAREANKLAKGKQRQNNTVRVNAIGAGLMSSDIYNSCNSDPGTPRHPNSAVVNPILHPIGQPLIEETETHVSGGSSLIATHKLVGRGRDQNQVGSASETKDNEMSSDNILQRNKMDGTAAGSNDLTNSTKVSDNTNVSGQGTEEINNNNNDVRSKEGAKVIDSSRIETNVAYLENLQMKSVQGYNTSANGTPTLDLSHMADKTHIASTEDAKAHHMSNNNDQQLTPSQYSEYTSQCNQSLLQSQSISPNTSGNSPLNQQHNNQQNSPSNQDPAEWQPSEIELQHTKATKPAPEESPLSKEIKQGNKLSPPTSLNSPKTDSSVPTAANNNLENLHSQSETTPIEEGRRQPVVGITNSSPLTSSGFESQPTTDQEDDLSPSSDKREVFKDHTRNKDDRYNNVLDEKKISASQPSTEIPDPTSMTNSGDDKAVTDPDMQVKDGVQKDSQVLPDSGSGSSKKEEPPTPVLTHQEKMATQYPPEVDEGIGLVPTEAAVLDSSVTEVCSDQGVTGCTDNGDSGISTTFLTSEDSVPEPLGTGVIS